MNYTADASDAEHLAGPSRWGPCSPKADRTSFPTPSNDIPSSPLPAPQQSQYPDQPGSPAVPRYHDGAGRSYHQSPNVVHPEEDVGSVDSSQQPQGIPQGNVEGSEHAQYQQAQYTPQQQRSGATRPQAARQQRPVPQYKLQARVTALERSG